MRLFPIRREPLFVFACARCDAELTVPLPQVSLPAHARQKYGNAVQLPVLMESGTFSVDLDSWGVPWRADLRPVRQHARLLVPVHPQTGQTWTPAGLAASAYPVPLPLGMWLWLVCPQPYLPVVASGGIPQDVLRDDPLPPRPNYLFRADWGTFQHALVRLPAVRSPWMRTILENFNGT